MREQADRTAPPIGLGELSGVLRSPVLDSMTFLNDVAQRFPDAISFAAGRPYEGFFDLGEVHDHLRVFQQHLRAELGDESRVLRTMLQYGPTKGIINDLVAKNLLVDEGIEVDGDSIVVTVGAQEAMYLTLCALRSGPDDVVLAPKPCYVGLTGAAQLVGMPVLGVAEGPDGIDLDDLVRVLRRTRAEGRNPRGCYVVADFGNPSGTSLGVDDRRRLLAIAEEHDILLFEDNPYGLFHDRAAALPTLKALDRERRVVYLGSFAKSGIPGARVGYVVADQRVIADEGETRLADQLAKLKSMLTVNTSPLAQALIGGKLLTHGCSLRTASAAENEVYQRNRKLLLAELARRFPARPDLPVTWNAPDGGFFVVVDVPFDAGDDELARCARDHGVLWTPMHHFYGDGLRRRQIRLSISSLTPDQIITGLDRLVGYVEDRARTPVVPPAR